MVMYAWLFRSCELFPSPTTFAVALVVFAPHCLITFAQAKLVWDPVSSSARHEIGSASPHDIKTEAVGSSDLLTE